MLLLFFMITLMLIMPRAIYARYQSPIRSLHAERHLICLRLPYRSGFLRAAFDAAVADVFMIRF